MAIDTENKITLTEEGKEDLEKELRELLDVTRPAVLKQLQEA
ncbi:MAG: transcription elongation factor GreA, partial [Malacoplasma sp.]|nr:transcription elongation factor GreA [Malacoplasma sp.]